MTPHLNGLFLYLGLPIGQKYSSILQNYWFSDRKLYIFKSCHFNRQWCHFHRQFVLSTDNSLYPKLRVKLNLSFPQTIPLLFSWSKTYLVWSGKLLLAHSSSAKQFRREEMVFVPRTICKCLHCEIILSLGVRFDPVCNFGQLLY